MNKPIFDDYLTYGIPEMFPDWEADPNAPDPNFDYGAPQLSYAYPVAQPSTINPALTYRDPDPDPDGGPGGILWPETYMTQPQCGKQPTAVDTFGYPASFFTLDADEVAQLNGLEAAEFTDFAELGDLSDFLSTSSSDEDMGEEQFVPPVAQPVAPQATEKENEPVAPVAQPPKPITNYRIFRNVLSRSPEANEKFSDVELEITGTPIQEITTNWTPQEVAQRRRIVRITRTHEGSHVEAHFSIPKLIEPADAASEKNTGWLQISCIFYRNQFWITSVELVLLVEFLAGKYDPKNDPRGLATDYSDGEVRKERRRIKSNIIKKFLAGPTLSEVGQPEFYELVMGYETRMPRNFRKPIKVMEFGRLPEALREALRYYTVVETL